MNSFSHLGSPYLLVSAILLYLLSSYTVYLRTPLFILLVIFLGTSIWNKPQYKMFIVWVVVGLILVSSLFFASQREIALNQRNTSDTSIAMESAAIVWLQGKNPYDMTFNNTPLETIDQDPVEQKYWQKLGLDHNPAMFHYAYPPASFIIPALVYQVVGFSFDLRYFFLPIVLFSVFIFSFLLRELKNSDATPMMLLLLLWLLLMGGHLVGVIDTFLFAGIIIFLYCVHKQHHIPAAILLGVLAAIKQTIWPFAFFIWLWALFQKKPFSRFYVVGSPLLALALILPFVLWNPLAFWDDTFSYFVGNTTYAYPVNPQGGGLPFILSGLGWSLEALQTFPYGILLALVTIPMLYFLVRALRREPTISNVFFFTGILLSVISLFYKNFHFNYLNFAIGLVFLGFTLKWIENGKLNLAGASQ